MVSGVSNQGSPEADDIIGVQLFCEHDGVELIFIVRSFSVANQDHTNSDCLVCCVCSHGDQDVQPPGTTTHKYTKADLVYGIDGVLYIRLITELFSETKCPSLQGKPKLFFIQVLMCQPTCCGLP